MALDSNDLSGIHKGKGEAWTSENQTSVIARHLAEVLENEEEVHIFASSILIEIGLKLGENLGDKMKSMTLDAYTMAPLMPDQIKEAVHGLLALMRDPVNGPAGVKAHLGTPGVIGSRYLQSAEFGGTDFGSKDEYLAYQMIEPTRLANALLCEWWTYRDEEPDLTWVGDKPVLLLAGTETVVAGSEALKTILPQVELYTVEAVAQNMFLEGTDAMTEHMTAFIRNLSN